jgi:hypothetical protein
VKKISNVATNKNEIFKEHKLTIGLDLGDRSSHYCILDEAGEVILEHNFSTTPTGIHQVLHKIPRSRTAPESPGGLFVRGRRDPYSPAEICKPTDPPLRYSPIAALFLESRADQTVICAPESSSASMLCSVNQLEGISNRSNPTRSRNSPSAAASESCGQ